MRTKKAIINIIANIVVQVTSIIISLLVPKLLIQNYGSATNGLIQMVTQIISYFGLIEGGVATAAGASLYKPLLEKDYKKINNIMTAVREFYFKTGIFFCILGLLLCFIYPITIMNEINFLTASIIVFLLSIISISGYLVFNKYNMLLVTDQKHYITLISSAVLNILVALIQIILIYSHVHIILVVMPTPILGLIRLVILRKYVKRNYEYVTYDSEYPDKEAISQKWNALSLNVSQMCKIVIPLIVLSLMFDLNVVSVYSIYSMIFRVGSSLMETIGNSLTSIFGNIVAIGDKESLKRVYNLSETINIMFITILSIGFYMLIHPFINLYIGINTDISYYCPILAVSFIINEAILNIRFSPKLILKAKGILKQVSKIAIFEIVFTLTLTPIFCKVWGYEAVLIGSILSGIVQTIFMIVYVHKNILEIKMVEFFKKIIIGIATIFISIFLLKKLILINPLGYLEWVQDAIIVMLISVIILMIFSIIFLRKDIVEIYYYIKTIFRRKKEENI